MFNVFAANVEAPLVPVVVRDKAPSLVLNVFQSVEERNPLVAVFACVMLITGVLVPVATLIGAVPVTFVTDPPPALATVHLPVTWFQLNICPVMVGAGVDSHAVPLQESSWPVAVGAGVDNPKVAPDVAFNETILPDICIPGVVPPVPTWFHADPL